MGKWWFLEGIIDKFYQWYQEGKEEIMNASLVFSELCPLLSHLPLVENMRAKFDPTFCDYLLRIGNGTD